MRTYVAFINGERKRVVVPDDDREFRCPLCERIMAIEDSRTVQGEADLPDDCPQVEICKDCFGKLFSYLSDKTKEEQALRILVYLKECIENGHKGIALDYIPEGWGNTSLEEAVAEYFRIDN